MEIKKRRNLSFYFFSQQRSSVAIIAVYGKQARFGNTGRNHRGPRLAISARVGRKKKQNRSNLVTEYKRTGERTRSVRE
jgi:hypothetical protein